MDSIEADIERRIFIIRGLRVMMDEELARLYQVTTKRLNQQVRRNIHRFPKDFLLQLTLEEARAMRSHFESSSRRNFMSRPFAFTEHGAIMLATVLNTSVAAEASVRVVRAFVRMRELVSTQAALRQKMDELESRVGTHDAQLEEIFDAIQHLIAPIGGSPRRIGFTP